MRSVRFVNIFESILIAPRLHLFDQNYIKNGASIIIMIEDSCAAQYFCANCDTFQDLKEHNLCEIKIFCNINVFIVTFDQFNAFSLVKIVIS